MPSKKKVQEDKVEDLTQVKGEANPSPQQESTNPGEAAPNEELKQVKSRVETLTEIELQRQAQQAAPPLTPQEQFEIDMRPYGGIENAIEFTIPEWGSDWEAGAVMEFNVTVRPLFFEVGKKYKAPPGIRDMIWGYMGIPLTPPKKPAEPTEVTDITMG